MHSYPLLSLVPVNALQATIQTPLLQPAVPVPLHVEAVQMDWPLPARVVHQMLSLWERILDHVDVLWGFI